MFFFIVFGCSAIQNRALGKVPFLRMTMKNLNIKISKNYPLRNTSLFISMSIYVCGLLRDQVSSCNTLF
jgi:hypothetical protein